MKNSLARIAIFTILIFVGNYAIGRFYHHTNGLRWIGLLGFTLIMVSVFQLFKTISVPIDYLMSVCFKEYVHTDVNNPNSISAAHITGVIMFLIVLILHILYWVHFDSRENALLERDGTGIKTVIYDRRWENKEAKGGSFGYYNYYRFNYKNYEVAYFIKDAAIKSGDTITIRFLPANPYNHKVKGKGRQE